MLQIARSEVVAGRFPAARALHSAVRSALDDTMKVDWTAREVRALRDELAEFLPLARRLDALLNDHASDTPQLVVAGRGPAQIGTLWTGPYLSAVYSLLVRVPDVLDRRSGLFLSQVIGPAAAASINRQLREGRPDGGRIRVADDGTVISRRDPMSPWFVVGRVTPDEWFPTVMLRAA
jgi:hypothetical protein